MSWTRGTTTYALSPVTVTCRGSLRVTTYPETPCCSPSTQHVPVPILSGCRPVPYVGSHAIENHSRNSENRRHCLNVPSVEAVHVPAHCVHQFFHGQSSSCFGARNMNG